MTSDGTSNQKCPHCEKGRGIVPCIGCQNVFCLTHFKQHREELSIEFEQIVSKRNTFYQTLDPIFQDKNFANIDVLNQVDQWEKETIKEVMDIANVTRQNIQQHIKDVKNIMKKRMDDITMELQERMEKQNYVEHDIELLNFSVEKLRKDIEDMANMNNIHIQIEKIDWQSIIAVLKDRTDAPKIEKQLEPLNVNQNVDKPSLLKPKTYSSTPHKCHTCGIETWQKKIAHVVDISCVVGIQNDIVQENSDIRRKKNKFY
ncbi:unnamed protein product [Didymodactylos carnosus]|uniref:Uncharacterized protein n=1 Tax=Didymodactylos carnosus TaxID=1234261 RepID=A0A814D9U8_9BILA|nr:unnamed protein product [Didymodactylos carnosus]CAF3728314.1 unnamed protein product [Didymodactylos carnosus]